MGLWGLLKPQEGSGISGAEMDIVGGNLGTAMPSSGTERRPKLKWWIEIGVLGRLQAN